MNTLPISSTTSGRSHHRADAEAGRRLVRVMVQGWSAPLKDIAQGEKWLMAEPSPAGEPARGRAHRSAESAP